MSQKINDMKMITLLSLGITTLLVSCSASKKITTTAIPLYETKWSLKKIHTDAGVEDVQTKAFIKFDELKKSAGGNGSCNNFGSSTTISNNDVSFKNIFSTKMYCEAVQKIENDFLSHLAKVSRFEIKGNTLSLYQGEKILLEFASE